MNIGMTWRWRWWLASIEDSNAYHLVNSASEAGLVKWDDPRNR